MKRLHRKPVGLAYVLLALTSGTTLFLRPNPSAYHAPTLSVALAPEKTIPNPPPLYLGTDRSLLREQPPLLAETQSAGLPPVTLSPIGPLMESLSSTDSASTPSSSAGHRAGGLSSAPHHHPDLPISVSSSLGLPDLSRQHPEAEFAFPGAAGGSSNSGPNSPDFPEPDLWATFPDGRGIQSVNNPNINPSPLYPPFSLPPVIHTTIPEPAMLAPFVLALGALTARRAKRH